MAPSLMFLFNVASELRASFLIKLTPWHLGGKFVRARANVGRISDGRRGWRVRGGVPPPPGKGHCFEERQKRAQHTRIKEMGSSLPAGPQSFITVTGRP